MAECKQARRLGCEAYPLPKYAWALPADHFAKPSNDLTESNPIQTESQPFTSVHHPSQKVRQLTARGLRRLAMSRPRPSLGLSFGTKPTQVVDNALAPNRSWCQHAAHE